MPGVLLLKFMLLQLQSTYVTRKGIVQLWSVIHTVHGSFMNGVIAKRILENVRTRYTQVYYNVHGIYARTYGSKHYVNTCFTMGMGLSCIEGHTLSALTITYHQIQT